MKFLSLFAGIGGLDLGLERAGWTCVGQVEIDPFCCAVLAKHWPDVPRFADVREVDATGFVGLDAIVGGFPCQDVSAAGRGAGVEHGARSGLWREYARIVAAVRPRWVVVENVPMLRTRGADLVLGDLAALGYTCWPCVVAAADLGAPHLRKRVWILAALSDAAGQRRGEERRGRPQPPRRRAEPAGGSHSGSPVSDPVGLGCQWCRQPQPAGLQGAPGRVAHRCLAQRQLDFPARRGAPRRPWEEAPVLEPEVAGAVHGLSRELVRWRRAATKALGNAALPQIAEVIGRAILEADQ